ncbi:hypothetical protein [Sabulicella glaciei]|uniref:Uncharacterized protein n=1 Tax=Sabulicella glaciei TaxID=2984948 RepID=A0ABT3P1A7_9PROT|nr:hypothetical protein [Roseococcus sp. MDT2-1-1]MCW8088181.1 hypothetical protein [Roseococcus sp. MDT2-1-1]
MQSAPGCLIDAELAGFLESPVMIIVGTGLGGVPEIGRGLGALVEAGGAALHLVVSAWQWPRTVSQARESGTIAITFARPTDYVTYQVKGQVEWIGPLTPALHARAARYAAEIAEVLAGLGMSPELTAPWRSKRDLVALRIRPQQAFVQTPGPRAGHALAERTG